MTLDRKDPLKHLSSVFSIGKTTKIRQKIQRSRETVSQQEIFMRSFILLCSVFSLEAPTEEEEEEEEDFPYKGLESILKNKQYKKKKKKEKKIKEKET